MIDFRNASLPARAIITALDLVPHPEGGHFRETWRDFPGGDLRGAGTSIFFLLAAGERSHWHRVDAAELWIWQGGAPLSLTLSGDGHMQTSVVLGPEFPAQHLHHCVPARHWQAAESLGAWTLVCCVVAPAFVYAGFELAPEGWVPG